MAMSTMDNASAQLAIALQLHDLNELEAAGTLDVSVIRLQRQQLEIDSGFDAVTFEASRRLALSIAKAVEDDSAFLTQLAPSRQIDRATFDRLVLLNHPPSTSSRLTEPAPQLKCTEQPLVPTAGSLKRVRSMTPEDGLSSASANPKEVEPRSPHIANSHVEHSHKKVRVEPASSGQHPRIQVADSGIQDPQASAADVSSDKVIEETAPITTIVTAPSTADCASCSEQLTADKLVKASCEHYYCKECFSQFIEASLQTHDGFPPKCCKIPIAFITVAENVPATVFSRYSARQAEIKNATALYCGVKRCGVKIENDRIEGVRATCVACWRDTCTRCRGEFPRDINGKKRRHVCKKDKAREQVLALAKQEGWQTCYQCGNLIALNFGCNHMRCRCKADFCYRCGTKWKNCECGDYDEPRLELRAARGVNLRAARRTRANFPADPRSREQQLAELQQRLQVDCDHNNFDYEYRTRQNPGRCAICEYHGWKYILRCDTCRFTACRSCHNYFGWDGGEDPWEEFTFGRRYYDDDSDEGHLSAPTSEDEST